MTAKKEKIETSKELEGIIKAIEKYIKKHDGNVCFHASFFAFEGEECDVVDDRMFVFGNKDCLQIDLKEMIKMIKSEKNDFISW